MLNARMFWNHLGRPNNVNQTEYKRGFGVSQINGALKYLLVFSSVVVPSYLNPEKKLYH